MSNMYKYTKKRNVSRIAFVSETMRKLWTLINTKIAVWQLLWKTINAFILGPNRPLSPTLQGQLLRPWTAASLVPVGKLVYCSLLSKCRAQCHWMSEWNATGLSEWVSRVLHPARHVISNFRDSLSRQSLALALKTNRSKYTKNTKTWNKQTGPR